VALSVDAVELPSGVRLSYALAADLVAFVEGGLG
jgi:hypothetical protein